MLLFLLLLLLATACEGRDRPTAARIAGDSLTASGWAVTEAGASSRFVPLTFADTLRVWGIMRGRLASLNLGDGKLEPTTHTAWSVHAGPGVVSWRNELGVWGMREPAGPRRLAPTELAPGYDGPPEVLWSPDGRRAVLSWAAEWDYHHDLLQPDGTRTVVASELTGYMLDRAVLWLDSARVLFEVVANGPRGGEPEYRESGWRGDLALLELRRSLTNTDERGADHFELVTRAEDGEFLLVAGSYRGMVLVTEYGEAGVVGHWLYDREDFSREPIDLPAGRSWAAGNTIVTYQPVHTEPGADPGARVRLAGGGGVADLGLAAEATSPPALSADGRVVAVRVLRDGKPVLVVARSRE